MIIRKSETDKRMTEVEAIKNIAENHRKPEVFKVNYYGRSYTDITDYYLNSTMYLPQPNGAIVQLMKRTKHAND